MLWEFPSQATFVAIRKALQWPCRDMLLIFSKRTGTNIPKRHGWGKARLLAEKHNEALGVLGMELMSSSDGIQIN